MRYWILIVCALLVAAAAPCEAATAEVVFVIDMRDAIRAGQFDAAQDTVGVRGGTPPLTWGKSLLATPIADRPGRYRAQLHMDAPSEPGQGVQYKFKIESPAQPDEGWEPARNRVFAAVAGQVKVERAFGSDPGLPPPQRTGRIERLGRPPSAFVSPREVQVWLPPSYEAEPLRRFPVLYLHDGQNVFDNQAAGAEWQVDEAAQKLVLSHAVEPMIIVAVASNGQRTLDYTPWPDLVEGRREGGGAAAYGRYLIEELKPLIDQRFRSLPGRDTTAIGGSSFGGLVTAWLLVQHAQTFGAGLVVSPSVWWASGALLGFLRAADLRNVKPPRVWLDMGSEEGGEMLAGARALRDVLLANGWPMHYWEAQGADHSEAASAARAEDMLKFLYANAQTGKARP